MTLAFNSLNIYSLCLVVHMLNSFAFIYLLLFFFCGNLKIIFLVISLIIQRVFSIIPFLLILIFSSFVIIYIYFFFFW